MIIISAAMRIPIKQTCIGAVVSNTTYDAPVGCAPPHAAWLPDTSRRLAFTCNGTDEIYIVRSGL